jgi:hypothetical protein
VSPDAIGIGGTILSFVERMVPARLLQKFNYIKVTYPLPDPLLECPCPREDIFLGHSPIGTLKGFQGAALNEPLHPQLLGGQLPFTNVPPYLLQGTPQLAGYFLKRELVLCIDHSAYPYDVVDNNILSPGWFVKLLLVLLPSQ